MITNSQLEWSGVNRSNRFSVTITIGMQLASSIPVKLMIQCVWLHLMLTVLVVVSTSYV